MNPRIKHIAFGVPSPGTAKKVCRGGAFSRQLNSATALRDEAALLLSISDICDKEMKTNGISMLWSDAADEDKALFPKFPSLGSKHLSSEDTYLKPRSELSRDAVRYPLRPRSVSVDAPHFSTSIVDDDEDSESSEERTMSSPVSFAFSPMDCTEELPIVTPTTTVSLVSHRRLPARKQSNRILKQAKREVMVERQDRPPVSGKDKKGKSLQGLPPKGVPMKKIMRKKFSWKNYPEVSKRFRRQVSEGGGSDFFDSDSHCSQNFTPITQLERFLVANREEYLRHSALNYTVQQKQYNNRLTDELLELGTLHGYIFDTSDFSYVTVRDRIRCYFKSYVQSAKKRGVLMGYAARKAGLLDQEDLEQHASGDMALIIKSP